MAQNKLYCWMYLFFFNTRYDGAFTLLFWQFSWSDFRFSFCARYTDSFAMLFVSFEIGLRVFVLCTPRWFISLYYTVRLQILSQLKHRQGSEYKSVKDKNIFCIFSLYIYKYTALLLLVTFTFSSINCKLI